MEFHGGSKIHSRHYSEHMRRETVNHICDALCYHGRERFVGFRQQTNIRR